MKIQFKDNLKVAVKKLIARVAGLENKIEPVVITATTTQTVSGLVLPVLTGDDVLKAYNAICAGKMCVIDSNSGTEQFVVIQGDSVDGGIYILFNHYGTNTIEYDESGTVTILPPLSVTHETWTFTLADDTTVVKEVVLWNSQA